MLARLSGPQSSKKIGVVRPMQSLRPKPSSDAFVTTVHVNALAWPFKRHSLARVALLREALVRLVFPTAY